ncbi:hypothetical protein CC78DRAFT_572235 [Lojkania enalia]|uniref:Uncharacterized protein n=1 Tax=Lojkania enalia TaxID=147567 RepID=A0A9P4JZW1_9PLEO|nr:hypothetical protein CC78DRAFT_572235 [Didymosphaeria enalia]
MKTIICLSALLSASFIIALPLDSESEKTTDIYNNSLFKRQAPHEDPDCLWICGGLEPKDALPPASEVLDIAQELRMRGGLCGLSRPAGNNGPYYTTVAKRANTEVNIFFNPSSPNVHHAAYDCWDLGNYVAAMMDTCGNEVNTVFGETDLPNCLVRELGHTGAPPGRAPGVRIEVRLPDWHTWSGMKGKE